MTVLFQCFLRVCRTAACNHTGNRNIKHSDPDRLSYQVAPILTHDADLTGMQNSFVLELPEGQFWRATPELHRQMFVGNVHGGTLVFHKRLITEGLRYPEVDLAEDAWLLHHAVNRGKRLLPLSNPGLFVYVRHGRNAWKEFVPGRFINAEGWERIAGPSTFPLEVLASYQTAAAGNQY